MEEEDHHHDPVTVAVMCGHIQCVLCRVFNNQSTTLPGQPILTAHANRSLIGFSLSPIHLFGAGALVVGGVEERSVPVVLDRRPCCCRYDAAVRSLHSVAGRTNSSLRIHLYTVRAHQTARSTFQRSFARRECSTRWTLGPGGAVSSLAPG